MGWTLSKTLHSMRIRILVVFLAALFLGCRAPIGARRSSTQEAYAQMEANALNSGEPSADTRALLYRNGLDETFEQKPEKAVYDLHMKAASTGDRDSLFALSEMSFLAAEKIRRSVKPWDARQAQTYYLGSAVYAYLFLFGEQNSQMTNGFDRRFRSACDLYNFSLGLAFAAKRETNAVVRLEEGQRQLPVGQINIRLDLTSFPWALTNFQQFVLGDQFTVHGLSVRNRQPGVGATLIARNASELGAGFYSVTPATAFLRVRGNLHDIDAGECESNLEVYSAFGTGRVQVAGQTVPLEIDQSVHMAYALNQSVAWKIHSEQFLSLHQVVPTGVYLSQPYERGRIPVIFVHGTYSSPVWWAEMLNSLRADPVLREKYQFWYFIYNSSAPVLASAARLRQTLTEKISELDPQGSDPALQKLVVIGHSQGGLLTKLISTDTGDELWNVVSDKPPEELKITEKQVEEVRRLFFLRAMPALSRVVFIATPHRGSYRAAGLIQSTARRLVSIPVSLASRAKEAMTILAQLKFPEEFRHSMLTSIDGMSPKNPLIQKLAEIPPTPNVKAHSIIAVKGTGPLEQESDGIVEYKSAHVEYVESEFIAHHNHSCQGTPAVIEEVRRILHLHLDQGSK